MVRLTLFTAFFMVLGFAAWAQSVIDVRSGVHPSYSRLVFDFDSRPSYTLNRDGETLTLTLEQDAQVDFTGVLARNLSNIKNAEVVEGSSGQTVIAITIPENSRYRELALQDRIILDVYNADGEEREVVAVQEERKPAPEPTPQPTAEPEPETTEEEVAETNTEENKTEEIANQEEIATESLQESQQEPEKEPQEQPQEIVRELLAPPDIQPHLITVSSTRAFGMAAFRRNNHLWLVIDDPEVGVPPLLSGPDKQKFGEFNRYEISGGLAYRIRLPDNVYVYGEGGGLDWRIVVSPYERPDNPVPFDREFDDTQLVRGANLIWPVNNTRKALVVTDPSVGDAITVITMDNSARYSGAAHDYVELERFESFVGMALRSKVDDLEVQKQGGKIMITRPGGLALARPKDYIAMELRKKAQDNIDDEGYFLDKDLARPEPKMSTIYNLQAWEMGGVKAINENQTLIMAGLENKSEDEQLADLLTLSKLNLANGKALEALGFLNITLGKHSNMRNIPEFLALRGAANALAGRYEDALNDFVRPELKDFDEIDFWKAITLAGVEDWNQAYEIMPKFFSVVRRYPRAVQIPVSLILAEIALRGGDTGVAKELLETVAPLVEKDGGPNEAAWEYLMGELERQRDNSGTAEEYWSNLRKGEDDLYRAKSGLALTRLQRDEEKITAAEAIDRLEGLRYAWRGDQLETLINFRLGKAYVENAEYLKGLFMMREAVSLSPDTKLGAEVTTEMATLFGDIFKNNTIQDLSAIDAIALYDEFQELTPTGREGDIVAQKMAERLAAADLLGRATELLQQQVSRRLQGEEKVRIGLRLAALQLLNEKPDGTLRTLDVIEEEAKAANVIDAYNKELNLLRARALSETNKVAPALALLATLPNTDVDVIKLRADISWRDSRWEDAAEALQDLIYSEDISLNRPINEYQAELILRRGVALNLSGNRVALANLRTRYNEVMSATSKARLFEVITRPRQTALLGGRDALTSSIGEVDLFGDFLESYKNQKASN